MSDLNRVLRSLYLRHIDGLKQFLAPVDGASGPLFISVPGGYSQLEVRLVIVGQQTYGWSDIGVGIEKLLETYRKFDLGRRYAPSPFWSAAHQLHEAVNPEGPNRSFLWSNLVKVDQHRHRPEPNVEEVVSSYGLLNAEIDIVKPHAVVFFSGPRYDDRLKATFPGVQFNSITPFIAQLTHVALPSRSFRTYHPRYLWLARHRDVLDDLARFILEA